MTRPTKKTLIAILSRVFDAPGRSLEFYKRSIFFVEEENDFVESTPTFITWDETEIHTINLALDLGYLRKESDYWEHHPEEPPDGRTVSISLTGKGFEYLNDHDAPFWERARQEISRNLITIVVSVASAILISFALRGLGL